MASWLAAFSLRKGRSSESADHCCGPTTLRAGRKVEGVLIKKSAFAEFHSVECSFFCTLLGGTFCCWWNALLVRRRWFENLPGTAHVIDRFVMPLRSCDTDKKQGESDWPGTLAPFRRPPQQRLGNALVWVALRATDTSIFFKTTATTPTVPEANVASQVLRWASAVKVSDLER